MFWLPLLGAGLGVGKYFGDQASANAQRKSQAAIERWSPYTGQHGQAVQDPSLFGNVFTGAAAGAMAPGMFPDNKKPEGTPQPDAGASMTPQPMMPPTELNMGMAPKPSLYSSQPSWMDQYQYLAPRQ